MNVLLIYYQVLCFLAYADDIVFQAGHKRYGQDLEDLRYVSLQRQLKEEKELKGDDFIPVKDREIIALIAYLQRLGTDIKVSQKN